MTQRISCLVGCARDGTRRVLKCPLIVLAAGICLLANPAFGYVLMNFNSDTAGSAPVAGNAVGIDSYLLAAGTSYGTVLSSLTWDAGGTVKSTNAYEGANMYDPNAAAGGQVYLRAWHTVEEIQTGLVPFSTYLRVGIDNNQDDTAINLGITFGGEPQFCLSDSTLGKWVFRLGLANFGGAFFQQVGGSYLDMGGTPFTENDWYKLEGTVDTVNKTWSLNKINLTTNQTDSWSNIAFADGTADDVGMIYLRGSNNAQVHTLYDKILIGTEASQLAGDANGDGFCNFDDLSVLINNYGTASGATWAMADFTDDGAVNFDDLSVIINNYGATGALDAQAQAALGAVGLGTVPEPSTLVLLVVGALAGLGYYVRRR